MRHVRLAIGVLLALAAPRPAAAAGDDLAGRWTITTEPPISVQRSRGQAAGQVVPIALHLTAGRGRLAGRLSLWRGDVQKTVPATGTLAGGALTLTAAGFAFAGTYDRVTGVATGTVLELPGRVPPDGRPTTFRMAR